MASGWNTERVLITVRTYPVPATKGIEVSCTAAVSDKGKWVRLFPVPYRTLPKERRFKKYQWIEVALKKASDPRPESFHLNIETIRLGRHVPPNRGWAARRAILKPFVRTSLCAIQKERDVKGHPTLGFFKPKRIDRLLIVEASPDWTPKQKSILGQKTFGFANAPRAELEKIPFEFSYEFTCHENGCKGHRLMCTDWEMAEAYRTWKKSYGTQWEEKFRARFERDIIEKCDTHFYVGTLHQYPKSWIIVGLFYPRKLAATKPSQPDFFENPFAA